VRIELIPATIAPEGFQAEQGFVANLRPKLAGAFESALILAAGGFNGPRAQRLVGQGLLESYVAYRRVGDGRPFDSYGR